MLTGCILPVVIWCGRKIEIFTPCSNNVTAINYSRCPSLFPSYRTRWQWLLRGQSSHSPRWGRRRTLRLGGCPSARPRRTRSSRRSCWLRRSSRTVCMRARARRRSLPGESHSFWCPEKGEKCNSPAHTQVPAPASNCSLRNQTEWRNPKAILGSGESQGTKSLIIQTGFKKLNREDLLTQRKNMRGENTTQHPAQPRAAEVILFADCMISGHLTLYLPFFFPNNTSPCFTGFLCYNQALEGALFLSHKIPLCSKSPARPILLWATI